MTNTNYIEVHHNLVTGEVTERPYTEDEIAATKARIAVVEAEKQIEAAKAHEKSALLDKLGITEDEAKLLLS
jgi:hypothetical protein